MLQDGSGQTPPPREGGPGLERHYYAAGSGGRGEEGLVPLGAVQLAAAAAATRTTDTQAATIKCGKMDETTPGPSSVPLFAFHTLVTLGDINTR